MILNRQENSRYFALRPILWKLPKISLSTLQSIKKENTFWKVGTVALSAILLSGIGGAIYYNQSSGTTTQNTNNNSQTEIAQTTNKLKNTDNTNVSTTNVNANNSKQPVANLANKPIATPTLTTTPNPSTTPTPTPSARQELASLKKGMAYAQARKILFEGGWQGVRGDLSEFDRENYVFKKLRYSELETCSGTGMGY